MGSPVDEGGDDAAQRQQRLVDVARLRRANAFRPGTTDVFRTCGGKVRRRMEKGEGEGEVEGWKAEMKGEIREGEEQGGGMEGREERA